MTIGDPKFPFPQPMRLPPSGLRQPVDRPVGHHPLGTAAVKSIESQPRKARPFPVVPAEGWPTAICILSRSRNRIAASRSRTELDGNAKKGQGRGFDGRLSRIGDERPAAVGQLAVDELLNASKMQLLSVAHALGSRGEPPDCQIS